MEGKSPLIYAGILIVFVIFLFVVASAPDYISVMQKNILYIFGFLIMAVIFYMMMRH